MLLLWKRGRTGCTHVKGDSRYRARISVLLPLHRMLPLSSVPRMRALCAWVHLDASVYFRWLDALF